MIGHAKHSFNRKRRVALEISPPCSPKALGTVFACEASLSPLKPKQYQALENVE
jgi:hypothetical protein